MKRAAKRREWWAEYSGHSGTGTLYYIFEVPKSATYADTIRVREVPPRRTRSSKKVKP